MHPSLAGPLPTRACCSHFLPFFLPELGSQHCGRGTARRPPGLLGPAWGPAMMAPALLSSARSLPAVSVGWLVPLALRWAVRVPAVHDRGASRSVRRSALTSFLGRRDCGFLSAGCLLARATLLPGVSVLTWLLCPGPQRRFPREEGMGTPSLVSFVRSSHGPCPHSRGHTGWTAGRVARDCPCLFCC